MRVIPSFWSDYQAWDGVTLYLEVWSEQPAPDEPPLVTALGRAEIELEPDEHGRPAGELRALWLWVNDGLWLKLRRWEGEELWLTVECPGSETGKLLTHRQVRRSQVRIYAPDRLAYEQNAA